jgi:nucleoside phosphorylase
MPSKCGGNVSWRRCGRLAGAVLAVALSACGESTVTSSSPPRRYAVLGTFPAETAPLLAQVDIDHTELVNGRAFRIGTLAGVPVVLGMTGIGLVNAATTTGELLDRFDVAGVIVSAVAGGSTQQIGDVAVPHAFALKDGTTYAVDPQWLALVNTLASSGTVALARCTVVAHPPPADPVCMPEPPAIEVGGIGLSSDSYGGHPFPCTPDGDDLYGCDVPSPAPSAVTLAGCGNGNAACQLAGAPGGAQLEVVETADAGAPVTQDMETAAIGGEAVKRGLPYIAFRAISDGGTGDPLGLVGFLPQFSAYYRFAARNAAAATVAFLKQVAALPR